MGKKKQKKKSEKAIRKARKEQRKQAKQRAEKGIRLGPDTFSRITSPGEYPWTSSLDGALWSQIGQPRVEEVGESSNGSTIYQYTWEFIPGRGAASRDLFYWRDHKEELERQEGLPE